MKEDEHKRTSPEDQSGQETSEDQASAFQGDEDDLDFEILDALESIATTGQPADTNDAFDLNLDDDLMFKEEQVPETDEFHIDEGMVADSGLGADADLEQENDDDTFSLGLDHDADQDLDLSFDDEIDLDFDDTFEGPSFDVDEENEVGIDTEEESADLDISPKVGLSQLDAQIMENAEDQSDRVGDEDEEPFDADFSEHEVPDMMSDGADADSFGDIDMGNLPELDEEMGFEVSDETEDAAPPEKEEPVSPEKDVISVNGEEVFNLGDEEDLKDFSAVSDSWGVADGTEDEDEVMIDEDIAGTDLDELAKDAQQFVSETLEETREEETAADEEFMASLDDIDIDLYEDEPEESSPAISDEGSPDSVGVEDVELPEGIDVSEETIEDEELEMSSLAEAQQEVEPDTASVELAETIPEESEPPEPEEAEAQPDTLEALGLAPRLTDIDIDKFEQMVLEAKTLQQYIEELEGHHPEIKERIYHKLFKEYQDRKTKIFREPEFISIKIDVDQDLQDMLSKRDEFATTIGNLNDGLEEVQVRHLVGEYTDDMLAERETESTAEIETWQAKTERLESFVTRYQELLDAEQALNPLDEESFGTEESVRISEDVGEGIAGEEEDVFSEEDFGIGEDEPSDEPSIEENMTAAVEDEVNTEPEVPDDMPDEESSEEMEDLEDLSSLADILSAEEQEDWEDSEDEGIELTTESFDESDFTLGDGFDTEEFELDDFSDTDAAVAESLAAGIEGLTEEEDSEQADTITCKKCGRSTLASEKFCVNCGAKAQ